MGNDLSRAASILLLLAGCSGPAEGPGAAPSATASTAIATAADAAAPAATPAPAPSAAAEHVQEHWAGCKVGRDPESLGVSCGRARFARRDSVADIDETRVKASAGSFYFGSTGSEELAEVRAGKLDDGTPAWISSTSGVLKSAAGRDETPRALVFIGVKLPSGRGVYISAVGPDPESALRDANAMWSSPPLAPK